MRKRIRGFSEIMKNKAKLVPLILICPLLFMANSAAPYAYPEEYEDFEVTNVTYGDIDSDYRYPVSIEVKNTGESYMMLHNHFFANTENESLNFYRNGIHYTNTGIACIGPNQSATLIADRNVIQQYELSAYSFYAEAYSQYVSATYSGVRLDEVEQYSDYALYSFTIEGFKYDTNYYYSPIVEFTAKGESYCIYNYSLNDYFYVSLLDKTLTAEDFEFTGIKLIQGRNRVSRDIESMWLTIWILLGITLFVGFLISLAFIPLIIKSATKKKVESNKTL